MKPTLEPGIEHELRFRVPESKTVPALYPESPRFREMPEVFATGYLVGLLEWASAEAINPHLDGPGQQTLGTHVDVSHTAATPIGLEITVRVRLTGVDGRRLTFAVEAHDGVDSITKGTHERFVIDRERFDTRMEGKKKLARGAG